MVIYLMDRENLITDFVPLCVRVTHTDTQTHGHTETHTDTDTHTLVIRRSKNNTQEEWLNYYCTPPLSLTTACWADLH